MTPENSTDRLLARLKRHRPKGDGGWTARCPAHDDTNNSLSIDLADDRILLKCFAGCSAETVVTAVGLQMSDLFIKAAGTTTTTKTAPITVATLAAAKGLPVEILTRYGVKDVASLSTTDRTRYGIKKPDGVVIPYFNIGGDVTSRCRQRTALVAKDGSWWLGPSEQSIHPYGEHELGEARRRKVLCITEGETDFWTLRAAGFPALGIPGGEMVKVLGAHHVEGIERVYVTQDRDQTGASFVAKVRDRVSGFGVPAIYSVEMPADMPDVKDVNDLYRRDPAGFKATFTKMLVDLKEGKAPAAFTTEKNSHKEGLALTALGDLLAEPEEVIHWVVDERIPAASVDMLAGKPKAGKSTAARDLAFAVATGRPWLGWRTSQGPVWYVALEEKRGELRKHFRAMGATGAEPIQFFINRAPEDLLVQLHEAASRQKPILIIIDTLQRLIRCRDMNDYAEVTTKMEPLLSLARETGAAMLLLHHASKSAARAGIDSALGSTALTGSVDNYMVLSRTEQVRTLTTFQRIGDDLDETILALDKSTQRVQLGVTRHEAEQAAVASAIVALLTTAPDLTESEVAAQVEGRTKVKRAALRKLVAEERVGRTGAGKRSDPFRYRLGNSCSLVPNHIREQENGNPETAVSGSDSSTYSRSRKTRNSRDSEESREQAIDPVEELKLAGFGEVV